MTCFYRGKSFSIKTIIPYLSVYVSRAECFSLGCSGSLSRCRKAFFLNGFSALYTLSHVSSGHDSRSGHCREKTTCLSLRQRGQSSCACTPWSVWSACTTSSSHDVLMFAMPIRASILRRRRASVAVTLPRVTLVFTKEARRKRLMLALISEAERSGAWRSAIKASKSARNCGIGCARRNSSRVFHSLLTSRKSVLNVLQHNARSRVEVLGLGTKRSLSSRTRSSMCC